MVGEGKAKHLTDKDFVVIDHFMMWSTISSNLT